MNQDNQIKMPALQNIECADVGSYFTDENIDHLISLENQFKKQLQNLNFARSSAPAATAPAIGC